jgi:hypothetical protein
VPEHDPIADLIVENWSRCTLPVRPVGGRAGTAFFYNELVESTDGTETVREWLLTADELTRSDMGEVRLRPESIEPAGAASDYLAVPGFKDLWSRRGGVAAMRTFALHNHGTPRDGLGTSSSSLRALLRGSTTSALSARSRTRPMRWDM